MRKGTILLISFLLGLVLVGGYIIYDQNKVNTNLSATNEELIERLDVLTESNSKMQMLNTQYAAKLEGSNAVITSLRNELQKNKELVEELLANADVSEETVAELQANINTLNQLVDEKDYTISSLEEIIENNNQIMASLNKTIEELVAQLNSSNELFNKLYSLVSNGSKTSITASDLQGVTEVPDYAFYGCSSLKSVTLPYTIEKIGKYAFYNCKNLTTFAFNNYSSLNIKSVGAYSFYDTDIATITLNGTFTELPEGVFYNCTKLKTINLPTTIEVVGNSAFLGTGITSMNLPNVKSIGYNAFYENLSLETITIGPDCSYIGDGAFYRCTSLDITIDSANTNYYTVNGCLYKNGEDQDTLLHIGTTEELLITEDVKVLGLNDNYRYGQNITLKKLEFAEGVTDIPSGAFDEFNALEELVIPSTIKTIGHNFTMCNELTSVTIKATEIPSFEMSSIFWGDPLKVKFYVPAESVELYKASEVFAMYVDQIYAIGETIEEEVA